MASPSSPSNTQRVHTISSNTTKGLSALTQRLSSVFGAVARFHRAPSRQPSFSSADLLQPLSTITLQDIERAEPCGEGGFGAVLVLDHQTMGKVALKRLNIRNTKEDALRKSTLREGVTWQGLSHSNVLQFLGIVEGKGCLYLVSPFVKNGSLDDYLHLHPDVDRPRLLWEAAGAIAYLHKHQIIHGDIKAANVLVSDDIHVLLCDFGLARFEGAETATDVQGVGTGRFQSPELMRRRRGKTYKSDVWAFRMTIYQVLSDNLPFHEYSNTAAINVIANSDERPSRSPTHSSSGESYAWISKVAERCWQTPPAERPPMQDVYKQLRPRRSVLLGHTYRVRCVAFAPDGNTVASGSYDYTVRSWDVGSGVQRGDPLMGHADWVQCLTFSPDSKTIASASHDRTIRRWDADLGTPGEETPLSLTHWLQCMTFSPNGKTIASGANDRNVRLWDVESGVQTGHALKGHADWVVSLVFCPDGKTIVSGSNDRTIRLWDMESGTPRGDLLIGHTDSVQCLAVSPDGRTIISGSKDCTIRLWDVESGMEKGEPLTGHTDWVGCLAISPDGRTIASGSNDRTIRLWDVESRTEKGNPLIGHTEWVLCVEFSPDGKTIASGSSDNTVRLWALEDD